MVTNKLTAEQKRKRMLEDKAKRKLPKEPREVTPYEAPKKINPRYVDNFYDFDNNEYPDIDN